MAEHFPVGVTVVFEELVEVVQGDPVERAGRQVVVVGLVGTLGGRQLGDEAEIAEPVEAFVEDLGGMRICWGWANWVTENAGWELLKSPAVDRERSP